MHSEYYKKAKDYEGEKVIVVGAGTAGNNLSFWSGCASILNDDDRPRHFQRPLRPRRWCVPYSISVSRPGDQGFFRCDHVPAQFYLYHVRQANCYNCPRKFVPNLL